MKKILFVLGIIMMLFVSGCSSGSSGANKSGYELSSFNGGEDGLVFSFLENAPPSTVRDQGLQPFSIMFSIENKGEADVTANSAHIKLSGFNPADFNLADSSKEVGLLNGFKKQGDNVIPGGRGQVTYSNMKYVPALVSGTVPMKIYANLCYPYQTKAFAMICISGDTTPAIDTKVQDCEIDGNKEYANSGAPVKIENVQEYAYGESSVRIQFDIVHNPTSDLANVYEIGSIDNDCNIGGVSASSAEAIFRKDKIKYTVESGLSGLNCEDLGSNTNTISLIENRYTVTCVQDTYGQETYVKPITITLDYDYLDRISKEIGIEHIQR